MEFKDWLMDKFLEWEKTQTNGRSNYSNFARYLGIGVNNYAQWRSGNNLPSIEKARILAEKLGYEVYEILGYSAPIESPTLAEFPEPIRSALLSASETIRTSGIKGDSPEAWAIVTEAMSKLGYIQIEQPSLVDGLKNK